MDVLWQWYVNPPFLFQLVIIIKQTHVYDEWWCILKLKWKFSFLINFFTWACNCVDGKHPGCDSSYFGRREFSFTLENDIYLRFQSFNNALELENSIKEKSPFKIDIGPVYTVDVTRPLSSQIIFWLLIRCVLCVLSWHSRDDACLLLSFIQSSFYLLLVFS